MRPGIPARLLLLLARAPAEKLSVVEQFLAGGPLPGSPPEVRGASAAEPDDFFGRAGEVAAVVEGDPRSGRFCIRVRPVAEAGPRQSPGRVLPTAPRYALRRDGALWHLTLNGREAVLKHEQGLCYVAEMLRRPGEPVKKLDLAARFSRPGSRGGAGIEIYNPELGEKAAPHSTGSVRERSLASDEEEARIRCKQRAQELKEILDDPTETDGAKDEAREELEQIAAHLSQDHRLMRDSMKAAGDAIRSAIKKLLCNLAKAGGSRGVGQPVLQEFGEHIRLHLVTPSGRYSAPGARKARGELTGCLLYEPPPGVAWTVSQ